MSPFICLKDLSKDFTKMLLRTEIISVRNILVHYDIFFFSAKVWMRHWCAIYAHGSIIGGYFTYIEFYWSTGT